MTAALVTEVQATKTNAVQKAFIKMSIIFIRLLLLYLKGAMLKDRKKVVILN
jgi:hypothetical protein